MEPGARVLSSVAVWGDWHRRQFTEVSLPSQLAPGNLPALARAAECAYVIFTTPEDEALIRRSPSFATLSSLMDVEFVALDTQPASVRHGKYTVMTGAHNAAVAAAAERQAALLFPPCDAVFSDGSFRYLHDRLRAGARALLSCGLRLDAAPVRQALFRDFPPGADASISVGGRDLVGIALQNLHVLSRVTFWDRPEFRPDQAVLTWTIDPGSVLVRAWHLHPILVQPATYVATGSTIDDSAFLDAVSPGWDGFEIVDDSDDMVMFSLDEPAATKPGRGADVDRVAKWALRATGDHHRKNVQHPICLHAGALSPDRRAEVVADSARIVADVLARVAALPARSTVSVLLTDRREFVARVVESGDPDARASAGADRSQARRGERALLWTLRSMAKLTRPVRYTVRGLASRR